MILVTGGAGFIGSHTCIALAQAGVPYLILDNFCNSRRSVLERLGRITGAQPQFIEGDVRDEALLARVFAQHPIDGVIHFAALKAVGESVREPLRYYDNNVAGTVALLRAMQVAGVRKTTRMAVLPSTSRIWRTSCRPASCCSITTSIKATAKSGFCASKACAS